MHFADALVVYFGFRFANTYDIGVVVDAGCDKQDSLMRGGLRGKRTSTLCAVSTVDRQIVDHTPPVIDSKARYWLRIAIFCKTAFDVPVRGGGVVGILP